MSFASNKMATVFDANKGGDKKNTAFALHYFRPNNGTYTDLAPLTYGVGCFSIFSSDMGLASLFDLHPL
jgi:hypothetical protein